MENRSQKDHRNVMDCWWCETWMPLEDRVEFRVDVVTKVVVHQECKVQMEASEEVAR